MKNLFKYILHYWQAVIAIVAILIVQAYCDLSLPAYTSDIVNVGILQGGIEDKAPTAISEEEWNKLMLFVSENDLQTVKDAYQKNEDSYDKPAFVLKEAVKENETELKEVEDALALPMMITSGFESGSEKTQEAEEMLKQQIPKEMLTEDTTVFDILQMLPSEAREELTKELQKEMKDMPDMILEQAAMSYAKGVYKDLGIDVEGLQYHYLFATGGKMIALALLGMAASILVCYLAARVGARVGRDIRGNVFRKVVGFSNNEFDHFSTASLITRSTNDIQQVQVLSVMILRMVLYAPILAIGGVYQVFQTNVSMSWIIAFAVGLIACVVLVLFVVAMPKFKILQKLVDKLNLVTREILTGLPVIRAFSTEKYEEKRFDAANIDLTKTSLFVNRAMTFMMPTMMFIMNGISVLIVWNGAHGISDGQMQVGDMMAFIQYSMQIIMSFLMLSMLSVILPRASVSASRIGEILSTDVAIKDSKETREFDEDKYGEVEFKNVSFKYPDAEDNVISNINFVAKPGQTTAFIGSTGSGKSTLINLIPRFFDVTEGEILVNGVDIRNINQHKLRDEIGYVPQKAVLFSGTIDSNIRYGAEDSTKEDIREAASIAQAMEFIESKPDKFETEISQGGTNVSGGQKQRLSIARALAKKPKIFIFDDSFSALDLKTDAKLRKELKSKTKDATVLIVAQRISTILHADQIVVLDEGKVVGIGTHDELMKNCEVYKQIALSQLSKEELDNE